MGRRVDRVLLALTLLLSPLLAACTHRETSEKSAPTAATVDTAVRAAFVRRCETSAHGTIDPAWRKHSIVAGPLVFYYADQFAGAEASSFAASSGRSGYYPGQKLLLLIRRGAVATVVVPESERQHAALLYDPAAWNDRNEYRVRDGERAVTFRACRHPAMTQFNGGFLVTGARCVTLDVVVRGERRLRRVELAFGTAC